MTRKPKKNTLPLTWKQETVEGRDAIADLGLNPDTTRVVVSTRRGPKILHLSPSRPSHPDPGHVYCGVKGGNSDKPFKDVKSLTKGSESHTVCAKCITKARIDLPLLTARFIHKAERQKDARELHYVCPKCNAPKYKMCTLARKTSRGMVITTSPLTRTHKERRALLKKQEWELLDLIRTSSIHSYLRDQKERKAIASSQEWRDLCAPHVRKDPFEGTEFLSLHPRSKTFAKPLAKLVAWDHTCGRAPYFDRDGLVYLMRKGVYYLSQYIQLPREEREKLKQALYIEFKHIHVLDFEKHFNLPLDPLTPDDFDLPRILEVANIPVFGKGWQETAIEDGKQVTRTFDARGIVIEKTETDIHRERS